MELKVGYKLTELGLIPDDWGISTVGKEFNIKLGKMLDSEKNTGVLKPYLGNKAVQWGRIDTRELSFIPMTSSDVLNFRLRKGDLLVCEGGEVGRAAIWNAPIEECYYQKALHRLRPTQGFNSQIMVEILHYLSDRGLLKNYVTQTSIAHLTREKLMEVPLPVPPPQEQRVIAQALSDVDALIAELERLIAKKRDIKQAAMQQLLTGRTRLPGFSGEWKVKKIRDIAISSSEKNISGDPLPVLTCSKHVGFLNSLEFFRSQVFSRDLSDYKIIKKGQIGYPANHIEEGSIGLQDLHDIALVSPIYIVFSVSEEINSFFLHRLLKLDSYRLRFKAATTSSVDRRGSLRWPAFSEITVQIPSLDEQTAIAEVLSDMDNELSALEDRLAKTRQIKQGMMQELLTGKTRLV